MEKIIEDFILDKMEKATYNKQKNFKKLIRDINF